MFAALNLRSRAAASLMAILALASHTLCCDAGFLIHDYQLNGSLTDSLGGPSLVNIFDASPPGGATGTLGPTGYAFGPNQGLSLSGAITAGEYSIVTSFNSQLLTTFGKIIDFKGRTSDFGVYTYTDKITFYPGPLGQTTLVQNQDVQFALTRDGSGAVNIYLDGVQQVNLSFTDTLGSAVFSGPDNIVNFFVDDANPGEAPTGFVDYIRIYDGALTGSEVAALSGISSVPEPSSLGLLTVAVGIAGWLRKRRKPITTLFATI